MTAPIVREPPLIIGDENQQPKTNLPINKKDQLSLAQSVGINSLRTGPIPTTPGGWGLRNPELKGPGHSQYLLVAVHKGGRWAEIGRYYDFY
jgi:hypothetical protein